MAILSPIAVYYPGCKTLPSGQLANTQLARPAGLEPATPGLEGRCSVRLSYGRSVVPTALVTGMVGVERFELPTHCSQSSCATRLRYTPKDPKTVQL
jgi:hypothetical protein